MLSKKHLFPFLALFVVILLVAACAPQAQTAGAEIAAPAEESAVEHSEAEEGGEETHADEDEDEHAEEAHADEAVHQEGDDHGADEHAADAGHTDGDSHTPAEHMTDMGMHSEGDEHSEGDGHAEDHEHGVPAEALAVENPIPTSDSSIAAGAATYTQFCVICHGNEGKGDGPGAAALNPKPADFSAEHVQMLSDGGLFWFITNGSAGTAMPPWKDVLSEQQRWELVNFLRTFENH